MTAHSTSSLHSAHNSDASQSANRTAPTSGTSAGAEIPVVRLSHLSAELVQVCRVALNKLSEGGRWDEGAIRLEMIEIAPTLVAHGIEMEAIGFSVAEHDLMVAKPGPEPDEEAIPELTETAITQLGDLWVLDENRLLCGNALNDEDFVRLMAGEKARVAFCDAPYNLKVDGVISGLGKAKHRDFAMASGEMSRTEFIVFLTGYIRKDPRRFAAGRNRRRLLL